MTELELKIYEIVRRIPEGKVATYGQIAAAAGNPHYSRFVGNTMHKNPVPFCELAERVGWKNPDGKEAKSLKDFLPVPCHRVVNGEGRMGRNFGMGGPEIQAKMLAAEGVEVTDGKVDLKLYGQSMLFTDF